MDRMRTSARDPHLVLVPNPSTSGVVLLMVDDDRIAFAWPELGKMSLGRMRLACFVLPNFTYVSYQLVRRRRFEFRRNSFKLVQLSVTVVGFVPNFESLA